MKSSLAEEDMGVLVGERLHMTHHCALAAQRASCVMGCFQLGSPHTRKTWTSWS